MKNIILLGSTGSVGTSVLEVIRANPDQFCLKGIAVGGNISALVEQVREFKPEIAAVGNEDLYSDLKKMDLGNVEITAGVQGLERLASYEEADIIFLAIAGTAALKPLIAALECGKTVALASKEPIVSAGMIIEKLIKKNGSKIIPVDSEHSAIMQCMALRTGADVRTLYITGSGGSLKDTKKEDFDTISLEQVLDHPKWDMGPKITVDSATLMNKGLEVIEARWLFDIDPERIKVVIHPQAIIHSMVEFIDGTISASMFCPDMRFPILRALSYPDILESDFPRIDFTVINNLTFSEPDNEKFPALELAFEALRSGGTMPAVLNAANEESVKLFLDGRIKFTEIIKNVSTIIKKHKKTEDPSLEDILDAEHWARGEVLVSC